MRQGLVMGNFEIQLFINFLVSFLPLKRFNILKILFRALMSADLVKDKESIAISPKGLVKMETYEI